MVSSSFSPAILLGLSTLAVAQLSCPGVGVTTINGIPTSISCSQTVVSGFPASACISVTLRPQTSSLTTRPVTSTSVSLPTLSTPSGSLPTLSTTSVRLPTLTTSGPSTTPTGQVCNGNINNCLSLLSDAIIAQAPLAGTENAAVQAARLAIQNGGQTYAYTANTLYALSLSASQIAQRLNAQQYLKVGSPSCSGLSVGGMTAFDLTCLSPSQQSSILSSTTANVKPTTSIRLSTTGPSITIPTTSLSISTRSTSLSISLPSTSLSVSLPSTSLSVSLPSTSLSLSIPSTSVSISLPTFTTRPPTQTLPSTSIPLPTTSQPARVCNGDLSTCIDILTANGDVITSQTCLTNGQRCVSNGDFITQAGKLAQSVGGVAYALNPSTGLIYALRVPSADAAVQLNAQANVKTISPTCKGIPLGQLYYFDFSCSGLSTTAPSSTSRAPGSSGPSSGLPTSLPSTRLPTTSLPSTRLPTTVPTTRLPTTLPSTRLPTTSLPTISIPTISIPTISIPTISIPTISIPTISLPTISVPTLSSPSTRLPSTVLPTSVIPTTFTTSRLPLPTATPLCNVPVSLCVGQTNLVSTRDCSGVNLLSCLSSGITNLAGATANLCALQGCGSYGVAGGNVQVTSPLDVQSLLNAIAAFKAQNGGTCQVALTVPLNDVTCPNVLNGI